MFGNATRNGEGQVANASVGIAPLLGGIAALIMEGPLRAYLFWVEVKWLVLLLLVNKQFGITRRDVRHRLS